MGERTNGAWLMGPTVVILLIFMFSYSPSSRIYLKNSIPQLSTPITSDVVQILKNASVGDQTLKNEVGDAAVVLNDNEVVLKKTAGFFDKGDELFAPSQVGFPTKYLTFEEVEFCHVSKGGPIPWSVICANDTTCGACIPGWAMKESKRLVQAFHDESNRRRRAEALTALLPQSKEKPVYMLLSDEKYLEMALNWMCSCEVHGIDYRENTIIIAATPAAHELATKSGLKSISAHDYFGELWFKEAYRQYKGAMPLFMSDVLELGYDVLFVDSDVVMMRDPMPWLLSSTFSNSLDIQTQTAPRWDASGQANTGFILIHSNKMTRIWMKSVVSMMAILLYGEDQVVWNTMIKHYRFRQIRWQNLPPGVLSIKVPPAGTGLDANSPFIVHFLGKEKRQRMKDAGLWFVGHDKCSIKVSATPLLI